MSIRLLINKLSWRIRRAVWRALSGISRADRIYSFRLPDGARFEYPLRSAIGEYLFAGSFEPAEVAFVRERLQAGDVVLDVGANAGLYTLLSARAVGETGHVYAFEPDARALALLRRNIALNDLKNVTIIEAAASNRTGQAPFGVASDSALSSLAAIDREDQHIEAWRTVDTIRLDDALKEHGIPRVSFIKMDVEGAEKLVLEGSGRLLSQARAPFTILFEAADENTRAFGYTVRELLDALRSQGFSVHGFDRSLELHPLAELGPGIGTSIYNFVAYKN